MHPERFGPLLYALMRLVFGAMFVTYGLRKFGLLDQDAVPLLSLMGAAAVIESIAGTLIAVGLLTRVAAFIAAGEMAVAYVLSHAPRAPLPVQNNGIPAVLFCFFFLYVVAQGAGRFSLDAARRHRAA
jgi:putative oxidoreductase